jgi:DNA polymerase III delta prime subunit
MPSPWRVSCLDDIVGNARLKGYLSSMIYGVRNKMDRSGWNLFLTGTPRSGKTSSLTFALQALACQNLDFASLRPCQSCPSCVERHGIHGDVGTAWHCRLLPDCARRTPTELSVFVANGPTLSVHNIDELLDFARYEAEGPKVVYIDEVYRLDHRVAEILLSPMDRYQVIWLASSAYLPAPAPGQAADQRRRIYEMFEARFHFRLSTNLPTTAEMIPWLAERCRGFGVRLQTPAILPSVAEKSDRIPGRALTILNHARQMNDGLLSDTIIEECVFGDEE